MAYRINGQRMTYRAAVAYIVAAMVAAGFRQVDTIQRAAEDYLFSLRPGETREYARARVSRGK